MNRESCKKGRNWKSAQETQRNCNNNLAQNRKFAKNDRKNIRKFFFGILYCFLTWNLHREIQIKRKCAKYCEWFYLFGIPCR